MYNTVKAIAIQDTNIYVGGSFTKDGNSNSMMRLSKWNGTTWSAVGKGPNSEVSSMAVLGSDLYIGGYFTAVTNANGSVVNATNIAKWNGTTWSAVGTGPNAQVQALSTFGTNLYVGGNFQRARQSDGSQITASCICVWDGNKWGALKETHIGIDDYVQTMALYRDKIIAGGNFVTAGGNVVNYICQWDGTNWSSLGRGLSAPCYGMYVMTNATETNLYVGGDFTTATQTDGSTTNVPRVAHWNGSAWRGLGNGVDSTVYSFASIGTNLYLGGYFSSGIQTDGTTTNLPSVACWNGSSWKGLGNGLSGGGVWTVAASGTNLYVGGQFTQAYEANNTPKNTTNIACWNGVQWTNLGRGLDGSGSGWPAVFSILPYNGMIYCAGSFTNAYQTGGSTLLVNNATFWDGTNWHALANGFDTDAYVISRCGTNLYFGGSFSYASNGTAVHSPYLAQWDGTQWSAIGSGVNDIVYCFAPFGTNLYVGGSFSTAGGIVSARVAKLSGVDVDTDPLGIASVSAPTNGNYLTGQNIDFTVTFNAAMTVTGYPLLPLTIGSTSQSAAYVSGSGSTTLLFRYTVVSGDLDTDGIVASSPITLNGGTIKNASSVDATLTFTPPTTTSVLVNFLKPTVTTTAATTIGVTNATLNGTVNPNDLATGYYFEYSSSSSTLATHSTTTTNTGLSGGTAQSASLTLNGLASGTTYYYRIVATNVAGSSTGGIFSFSTTIPITSVTAPTNGNYTTGQYIEIAMTYGTAVAVTGVPRIRLTIGESDVYATPFIPDGGPAPLSALVLYFHYMVQAGDYDANGITVHSPIDLNGGTIIEDSWTSSANASLTFNPPDTTGVLANLVPPAAATTVATTIGTTNATLNGTVNPNNLDTGYYFEYSSSSSTLATHSTTATNTGLSGSTAQSASLTLNGLASGTTYYYRIVATNVAGSSTGGIFNFSTTIPITSVTAPTNGNYTTGQYIEIAMTYGTAVAVTGVPRIRLTIGASDVYATPFIPGGGPAPLSALVLYFHYMVQAGDYDANGITVHSPIDLNGGTIIEDSWTSSANASLTFNPPDTTGVLANLLPPSVTTTAATTIETTNATLNGTVNPNNLAADACFQYSIYSNLNAATTATLNSNGFVSGHATQVSIPSIRGLCADASGNIYVVESVSSKGGIVKITPNGSASTVILDSSLNTPTDVAADSYGNLYVSVYSSGKIYRITPTGVASVFTNLNQEIFDITMDRKNGVLYVVQYDSNTIVKLSTNNAASSLLAGSGSPGSANGSGNLASFNTPGGIDIDQSGNVFVADSGNNLIRKITAAGVVTTVAGVTTSGHVDGPAGSARFNFPRSVAVDTNTGNLFVVDGNTHYIRLITSDGTVSTIAGNGSTGFVDGTGTGAQFNYPTKSLVVGGMLYVSDYVNNALRRVILPFSQLAQTNITGTMGVSVSLTVSNLTPATTYYYRVQATNWAGSISGNTSNFTTLSTNALLASLVGSPVTFTPSFSSNTLAYSSSVANTLASITLTPTLVDTNATLTINGIAATNAVASDTIHLAVGTNIVPIIVTAQDGVTKGTTIVSVVRTVILPEATTLAASSVETTNATLNGTVAPYNLASDVFFEYSTLSNLNEYQVTTYAGSGGVGSANGSALSATFHGMCGLKIDKDGNLYLSEDINHDIRKIAADGTVSTFVSPSVAYVYDAVPDDQGNVYFLYPYGGGQVYKWASGGYFRIATLGGNAYSLAVDKTRGIIYVTDHGNHRIYSMPLSGGSYTNFAGSASAASGTNDGIGTAARFNTPRGMTIDQYGNLFVADQGNNRVRKITPAGVVTTVAGWNSGFADGVGTNAMFTSLCDVSIDTNTGNLFVADQGNNRIRKITSAGVVTTVAGSATSGYADGAGSAALFDSPAHLAVANNGTIYVVDVNNQRIRKIVPATGVLAGVGLTDSGSVNYVVTGLTPETTYYFRATITNIAGSADGDTLSFTTKSTNALLTNLAVSAGALSPAFSSNTLAYTNFVANAVASITVTPTAANTNAALTINGTAATNGVVSASINLVVGTNTIALVATAQDGTTKGTTTVSVIRMPLPAVVTTTNSSVSATTATLWGTVNPNGFVASATFQYSTDSGMAGFLATATNGAYVGITNSIVSTVINNLIPATTYYYLLAATNAGGWSLGGISNFTTISTNALLTNVVLSSGSLTPSFASNETAYSVSVDHTVTGFTIAAAVADTNATLAINGASATNSVASGSIPLLVGTNVVSIIVTAQDGLTKGTTTVSVVRAALLAGVLTGPVSNLWTTNVILNGTVNPFDLAADAFFQYSSSSNLDGAVSSTLNSNGFVSGAISKMTVSRPYGMGSDRNGNVYVASLGAAAVFKISPEGVASRIASNLNNVVSVTVDNDSNVFAGVYTSGQIYKISPAGTVSSFATAGSDAHGIAFDRSNSVFYTTEYDHHRIWKITTNGTATLFAGTGASGTNDGTGTSASFYGPLGIDVDQLGNVFVAEHNNNAIRKITPSGVVTTVAGIRGSPGFADGPAASACAKFRNPGGVSVDTNTGNLYVADTYNYRIRLITPDGTVSTIAGSGSPGFVDGTGESVLFNAPIDLAYCAGSIYVADMNNNAVRKLSSQLAFLAQANISGSGGVAVSLGISNLTPATTYFYRVQATNWAGLSLGGVSNFTTVSTNALLSGLSFSCGSFTPAFASNVYFYSNSTLATSVSFTATTASSNASLQINSLSATSGQASSPFSLVVGSNTFVISVTAQDGTVQSYTNLIVCYKIPASVVLANLSATFDGAAKSASASTTPSGLRFS